MSASSRVTERGIRKRLLRIEAETYRLEMASNWRELRRPMTHLKQAPVWFGILGLIGMFAGKSRLLGAASNFLAARRLEWLAKLLPLFAGGWRVAGLLRGIFTRIHLPKLRSR